MLQNVSARGDLELWGGIECTVNRVGDRYFDQLEMSGHDRRPDDLLAIAELGIRTLRYPILWERTSPTPHHDPDWTWAAERLEIMRCCGIRPIVGLVHHGSGPPHTDLLSPEFESGLATFAGQVARRFPEIHDYVPVNEPLTTARFSALYGHWYPHTRDSAACMRALLNQCRAVVLAMREIRRVNPGARLVQTEDLGECDSTAGLAYQAAFENERRWLTWDLLCGRVRPDHPMYGYMLWLGIAHADIDWFVQNCCPPDLIGVNYYVTSERFLDDRIEHYPGDLVGTNGRQTYADVETVRVRTSGLTGLEELLMQAWRRYGIPVAVTEVHLGCSVDQQIRWLCLAWNACQNARTRGADVRAATVWSLIGAFDWDCLLTQSRRCYEPGALELISGILHRTSLAEAICSLAAGKTVNHPDATRPGWWEKDDRLVYPPYSGESRREPLAGGSIETVAAAPISD